MIKKDLEQNENHLLFFVFSISAGLIVFLFNANVTGPTIQPDEGNYLANAAAIAGYRNDFASNFFAGYSIILAPAFLIAKIPSEIWAVVRAINAMLFACSVFVLFLLAKYFSPTSTVCRRYASVVVVSLYPAWIIMAGYSSAQVAFTPVFLLMLVVYIKAINSGGASVWLLLGLLSGFLFWVHPTGIAPIIAIICSAFYVAYKHKSYGVFVLLLLVIINMIFFYQEGMSWLVHERMNTSGLILNSKYPSVAQFFFPLLSLTGIKEVVARIAGQVFYISLGTMGLFGVGLYSLKPHLMEGGNASTKRVIQERAVAIFIWLSLIGLILITALLFTEKDEALRLDEWMHGRYIEVVLGPILLAGVLHFSTKKLLWTVPVAIFCTWVLSSEMGDHNLLLKVNIPAFWQAYFIDEQNVWGWLTGGIMVVFAVAMVPRKLALIMVTIVFCLSGYLHIKEHVDSSVDTKFRWTEALRIREQFPPGTCVGFEYAGLDSHIKSVFWKDLGFILYDYQLKRMSYPDWLDQCDGPFFSYLKNVNNRAEKIYLTGTTPLGGPMVWEKR